MNKSLQLLILLLSLFILSCGGSAGIVDETDTEITATLVDTTGTVLANVPVRFYNHKDTVMLDSVQTDAEGNFTVNMETLDTFSIWAETDTSAFFRGGIALVKDSGGYNRTDTLNPYKKIYVPVVLQPQHDVSILRDKGHILGTNLHLGFPVDNSPYIILERIPPGMYSVVVEVNEDKYDYSPTTKIVDIFPNSPDTLDDTLFMRYYGIPIIEGISATFDTLKGNTTISWENTDYQHFDSYLIYRNMVGYPSDSLKEIGATKETTFIDTTLTEANPEGTYKYLVKIRHKNQEESGIFYHEDTVQVVHPSKEFNIVSQTFDTLYLHYEETLDLNISKWFGEAVTTSYKLENMTDFVSLTDPEKLPLKVTDTYYDSLQCIIAVSGRDTTIYDTLHFAVVSRWNKSTDAFFTTGRVQKAVQFNDSYFTSVLNGNKQTIYTSLDGITWTLHCDSAVVTYDSSWASNLTVCMDKLWLLDGNSMLFSSVDGSTWIPESVTPIESPWELAEHENRVLGSRNNSVEILFENSDKVDKDSKLTQYTFFSYEPTTKVLNSSVKHKNLYPAATWIEHTEDKGFQIFVYETKSSGQNTDRAIVLYEVGNSNIDKITSAPIGNGDTDYASWEKTPQLTGIFCNGGLQLFNGWDADNDLFFRDASLWTKENNKENVYDIIPTLEEMKNETNAVYVKTGKGLVLVSPRGIFTNY